MNPEAKELDQAVVVKPYARLVSLTVRPEHVFHFPQGLPAFEEFKDYVFTIKPDTSPFVFMQSLEPAGLSFVCIDPFLVRPDYAPRIGIADQEVLNLSRPEALMLLSIVTVRPHEHETTTNLQGPLAINIENSIGKQVLCDGQSYPVQCRIWDAISQSEPAPDAAPPRKGTEHASV